MTTTAPSPRTTHLAALSRAELEERVNKAEELNANLRLALEHSRDIGAAIGVIMAMHKVSREEAFDLLREVSMRINRKLFLVALDVIDTGALPPR